MSQGKMSQGMIFFKSKIFGYPILERRSTILLLLLLCMSRSGYPPWILKRGGLESSGRRLISSIGKIKRVEFSSNRPTGPIQSSSCKVCFCVVCVFVPFSCTRFWCLFPEVGCPKSLEIQNLLGKVLERSGLRIEHFCWEVV